MSSSFGGFKQFITRHNLPVIVEVQEGFYGTAACNDFSSCDVYKLESVEHLVNVTLPDSAGVSKNIGVTTLPLDFEGQFILVPTRLEKKTKIGELVKKFSPPFCLFPRQDLNIQNVTIHKDTKIEVFEKNGKGLIVCICYFTNGKHKSMLLRSSIEGYFDISKMHSFQELVKLMPVTVIQSRNKQEIESGIGHIPGLSAELIGPLVLSKIDVVNCISSRDLSNVMKISIESEIEVKQVFGLEYLFHKPDELIKLTNLTETTYPFCAEVVDSVSNVDFKELLKPKQLLIIEKAEQTCKVLVRGKNICFAIPVNRYNGRFVRVPRIFQTADDLWQDRYTKKVRVTEDYIVSSSQLDSIFVGDILTATDCKVVSLQDGECEVLICSRESTLPGQPRVLRVPSYAVGNFEEVEFPLDTFTLSHMPCELPFRARLQATPQQRKHNKDDATLRDEAPLTFKLCFNEINILVSVFDESKNTTTHQFIIPEHVSVKVKRRRMPLGYRIPRGSPSYENRLMIDLLSETEYNLLYTNNQAYVEPTAKAPPIPPRSGAKPKQHRACKSQGSWSDSDDDDDYDKPNEIIEAKKSATLNCTGTYVIPDRKHTVKLPLLSKKNMTLNFRKLLPKKLHRSKESTSDLSVYESKYETIESGNTDNDGYLQPKTIKHVDPEVEKLQHRLVDMEVNQEALEKLRELSITQEELVHQLTICSDNDLMIRLKFKKLEIAGLRSLMT